jgi:hypothetical protein
MTEDEILKRYGRKGKLTTLPAKHEARLEVLAWVARPFTPGVTYREAEVNDLLRGQEVDHVTLRRLLIDYGFLTRQGGIYQVAPDGPWPSAQGGPVGGAAEAADRVGDGKTDA